jgi:hypothetical protein
MPHTDRMYRSSGHNSCLVFHIFRVRISAHRSAAQVWNFVASVRYSKQMLRCDDRSTNDRFIPNSCRHSMSSFILLGTLVTAYLLQLYQNHPTGADAINSLQILFLNTTNMLLSFNISRVDVPEACSLASNVQSVSTLWQLQWSTEASFLTQWLESYSSYICICTLRHKDKSLSANGGNIPRILNVSSWWRWVTTFTLRPICLWGKSSGNPLHWRLFGSHSRSDCESMSLMGTEPCHPAYSVST